MSDRMPKQSHVRAHKKNIGAVKTLRKRVDQMQKDRRKAMQNIDQEVIDNLKFLEQVQYSTGNSISYEEVYPSPRGGAKGEGKVSAEKFRPTKSSVLKMEVKLRKSLAEARYVARRDAFFSRWEDVFNLDLKLDDWLVTQHRQSQDVDGGEWVIDHLEEVP